MMVTLSHKSCDRVTLQHNPSGKIGGLKLGLEGFPEVGRGGGGGKEGSVLRINPEKDDTFGLLVLLVPGSLCISFLLLCTIHNLV